MKDQTVKRCMPFLDSMSAGFIIPLSCNVHINKDMEVSWDPIFPGQYRQEPYKQNLGFHPPAQVAGTPLEDPNMMLLKFHNYWTISMPPGWSLLFVHPLNRQDLPFRSVAGLVDCDHYNCNFVNLVVQWLDKDFVGTLPKGTPVVLCIPFKREKFDCKFETLTDEELAEMENLSRRLKREQGVYRREFRAKK